MLVQDDINNGGVKNSATVSATTPNNQPVTDITDNIDNDGDITSDPTESPVTTAPSIEVMKTSVIVDNGDGVTGVGDKIAHTITVSNR